MPRTRNESEKPPRQSSPIPPIEPTTDVLGEDRALFDVDPMNVAADLRNQVQLMLKYSEMLADAKKAVGEREAKLELVESELMLNLRRNPEAYGLPSTTVDAIKAGVIANELYQKAVKRLIVAKHRVDLLQGIVNTINHHRKACVEGNLHLMQMGYLATPRMPDQLGKGRKR